MITSKTTENVSDQHEGRRGSPMGLGLSPAMALLLSARVRALGVFRTVYFLPSLLPATASGMVRVFIFHPTFGLLNRMLAGAGIEGPPWTDADRSRNKRRGKRGLSFI
jgi:ABC-type sugar transport system permease subunit